jgi:hypothetical protein
LQIDPPSSSCYCYSIIPILASRSQSHILNREATELNQKRGRGHPIVSSAFRRQRIKAQIKSLTRKVFNLKILVFRLCVCSRFIGNINTNHKVPVISIYYLAPVTTTTLILTGSAVLVRWMEESGISVAGYLHVCCLPTGVVCAPETNRDMSLTTEKKRARNYDVLAFYCGDSKFIAFVFPELSTKSYSVSPGASFAVRNPFHSTNNI